MLDLSKLGEHNVLHSNVYERILQSNVSAVVIESLFLLQLVNDIILNVLWNGSFPELYIFPNFFSLN